MKQKRVLSVTLTLCLLLMTSAVPASSQSTLPTKTSSEYPVLQLNTLLRFLNHNGLPSDIPAGTYQVSAQSSDTLQLSSTSTREMQYLQATPMTHTESLKVPYPILIEEAGWRGHVHIVLLLPDGQGLDAEGRKEEIQTRGAADLNRFAFTPTRQYSGVVMQQGRVTTDPDLNEQDAVASSLMSGLLSEMVPSYGRVTLEQGRIQLDAEARQSLHRRCRFCAKKP